MAVSLAKATVTTVFMAQQLQAQLQSSTSSVQHGLWYSYSAAVTGDFNSHLHKISSCSCASKSKHILAFIHKRF